MKRRPFQTELEQLERDRLEPFTFSTRSQRLVVKASHSHMASLGWTRVDPRPWGKLNACWTHVKGWELRHCGHPTALTPWALYGPHGGMIRTGAAICGNPDFGTAWPDLLTAAEYVRRECL